LHPDAKIDDVLIPRKKTAAAEVRAAKHAIGRFPAPPRSIQTVAADPSSGSRGPKARGSERRNSRHPARVNDPPTGQTGVTHLASVGTI